MDIHIENKKDFCGINKEAQELRDYLKKEERRITNQIKRLTARIENSKSNLEALSKMLLLTDNGLWRIVQFLKLYTPIEQHYAIDSALFEATKNKIKEENNGKSIRL